MDKTFQREDLGRHGFACKIVPEYSEEKQKRSLGAFIEEGQNNSPLKHKALYQDLCISGYVFPVECA